MKTLNRLGISIGCGILLLTSAELLLAETGMSEHKHTHEHNDNTISRLSLNHGEKWKTDNHLRQGIQTISDAVVHTIPAYHQRTLTKAESQKLANLIHSQVNYLIDNCRLERDADTTLHVLIGNLLSAADKIFNDPLSEQGMPHLVKTLHLYQDYFEHPGLKIVR